MSIVSLVLVLVTLVRLAESEGKPELFREDYNRYSIRSSLNRRTLNSGADVGGGLPNDAHGGSLLSAPHKDGVVLNGVHDGGFLNDAYNRGLFNGVHSRFVGEKGVYAPPGGYFHYGRQNDLFRSGTLGFIGSVHKGFGGGMVRGHMVVSGTRHGGSVGLGGTIGSKFERRNGEGNVAGFGRGISYDGRHVAKFATSVNHFSLGTPLAVYGGGILLNGKTVLHRGFLDVQSAGTYGPGRSLGVLSLGYGRSFAAHNGLYGSGRPYEALLSVFRKSANFHDSRNLLGSHSPGFERFFGVHSCVGNFYGRGYGRN
ncbi:uncharacterized protein [Cherax quadricarinatus]|uniref:uncharacterized protein n=1 Tax=Cherax quadricarinatus TaxID=27406 RepID=UPI00387E3D82